MVRRVWEKELNILYAELQDLAVKIKIWAIIEEASANMAIYEKFYALAA